MISPNGDLSLGLLFLIVLILIDDIVGSSSSSSSFSSSSSPHQEQEAAVPLAAKGVLTGGVDAATESAIKNIGGSDTMTLGSNHRVLQSSSDSSCPNAQDVRVEIQIVVDLFDEDIGWTLANACGTGTMYNLPQGLLAELFPAVTVTRLCVPSNVPYIFTLTDAYGDGMNGTISGSYKILLGGSVVATGPEASYTSIESKTFGAGSCPSPGAISTSQPIVDINHLSEIPSLFPTAPAGSSPSSTTVCPAEFTTGSLNYKAGDRASKGGFFFECVRFPNSLYCSQVAFLPDLDSKTEFWKQAWTLIGPCTTPAKVETPAPADVGDPSQPKVFLASALVGCPERWVSAAAKYQENDQVSVVQDKEGYSNPPLAVYKCKAWPYTFYCGQYSPLSDSNGINKLAWEYVGDCAGAISPTASPTFTPDSAIAGCPVEYNDSNQFKAGDQVSRAGILYECREYPFTGYCNQKGTFAPGKQYDYMAWKIFGPCNGALAPASALTANSESPCTYVKAAPTGSTNSPAPTPVGAWSSGTLYEAGDQVRIGATKFQCKPWPFYLWCRIAAYKPTLESTGLWTDAWTLAGTCSENV